MTPSTTTSRRRVRISRASGFIQLLLQVMNSIPKRIQKSLVAIIFLACRITEVNVRPKDMISVISRVRSSLAQLLSVILDESLCATALPLHSTSLRIKQLSSCDQQSSVVLVSCKNDPREQSIMKVFVNVKFGISSFKEVARPAAFLCRPSIVPGFSNVFGNLLQVIRGFDIAQTVCPLCLPQSVVTQGLSFTGVQLL